LQQRRQAAATSCKRSRRSRRPAASLFGRNPAKRRAGPDPPPGRPPSRQKTRTLLQLWLLRNSWDEIRWQAGPPELGVFRSGAAGRRPRRQGGATANNASAEAVPPLLQLQQGVAARINRPPGTPVRFDEASSQQVRWFPQAAACWRHAVAASGRARQQRLATATVWRSWAKMLSHAGATSSRGPGFRLDSASRPALNRHTSLG